MVITGNEYTFSFPKYAINILEMLTFGLLVIACCLEIYNNYAKNHLGNIFLCITKIIILISFLIFIESMYFNMTFK